MQPDSFSPMYTGDLLPTYKPTFYDGTGAVVPLAGASSFTMFMRNADTGDIFTCDPAHWALATDGSDGKAVYTWHPGDTDIPGTYEIKIRLLFGTLPRTFAPHSTLVIKDW